MRLFNLFNSLKSRIFIFFVLLLLILQVIFFWVINQAISKQEDQRLVAELSSAANSFQTYFTSNHLILNKFNQTSTKILAQYFNDDTKSFLSALENFRQRIDSDLAMAVDTSGYIKAQIIRNISIDNNDEKNNEGKKRRSRLGPQFKNTHPELVPWLEKNESNKFYLIKKDIFQFSSSEIKVANVETIGWIGFGNFINHASAIKYHELIGFHLNFILSDKNSCQVVASSRTDIHKLIDSQNISCDDSTKGFESAEAITLGSVAGSEIQVIIYGLRAHILDSLQHQWILLALLIGFTLFISLLGAYLIASSISKPLALLIKQVKHITQGNYDNSVMLKDSTEFGHLANEFNTMQKAIIDREEQIIHNAGHDHVTNLPNRSLLCKMLQRCVKDTDKKFGIFLIKINHIRNISETLGYSVADDVIKSVAERLSLLAQINLLAHLRRDEFAIIIKDLTDEIIPDWVEQINAQFTQPYISGDIRFHFQTNIGVALCADVLDPGDFLRMADSALQVSCKQQQAYKLYDIEMDQLQSERLILMNDLHNAVENNEMRLFYQPKLDLETGKITHVEALIRWFHPERGMVPPDKFILIAENTGQIDPITDWVLDEAARQYSSWKQMGYDVKIAVNISAINLKNEDFYDSVLNTLNKHNITQDSLELEITESAVVDDPKSAIELLSRFYDTGFSLSIDDYGTGYSSLAQLKQLPVHELKIDMHFVLNLPKNEDDKIIVQSTIELAHSMGLTVVAEGVETAESMAWLKERGCELIQGYYISKPQPADELMEWTQQAPYKFQELI